MKNANQLKNSFDSDAAEQFATSVAGMIDSGAIALMLSVGHKLGLFEHLAELPPSTSWQIADKTGYAERYLREWLAVMVVGRVIEYEPAEQTYFLPAEHAVSLSRQPEFENLAVYAQCIPLMAGVYPQLLELFRTGGGLTYQDFPCFHDFMAEDSGQTVVAKLLDTILPLAEELPERLADGVRVLDAGCGKGLALIRMAGAYPRSHFTGYDLCTDAIQQARNAARVAGLKNITFEIFDLSDFTESGRYDLITSFDAVHDQKDPQAFLAAIHRALKPGGVHLMQDIGGSAQLENNYDFPMAALLYTISCTHCTPVSIGQNGAGLGSMWGRETALEMLKNVGFVSVGQEVFEHDPMNIWFVSRKGTE